MPDETIKVEGMAALWAALAALPTVADRAATKSVDRWTVDEESRIVSAASRVDAQARLAAKGVKGGAGRIRAGGSDRLPNGGTHGDLFFGAEFGGGARPTTRQFRPYNPRGYWFFPTVEADEADNGSLMDAAADGLEAAANRWDD